MSNEKVLDLIKETLKSSINYTERAARDMKKAHFTEGILKDILLNPREIKEYGDNNYIVFGRKTAKIRIEVAQDNSLLIHWVEYNKVAVL